MAEEQDTGIGQFGLTPDALGLIREVFRGHPEIERVSVFGSRAMGRFENWSDVDLALWGNLDRNLVGRIMRELDELPLPYTFDVQAYDAIRHPPLKQHIDEVGKPVYSSGA